MTNSLIYIYSNLICTKKNNFKKIIKKKRKKTQDLGYSLPLFFHCCWYSFFPDLSFCSAPYNNSVLASDYPKMATACLADIGIGVAGTLVGDYVVKPIERRIRYLFRFKKIVEAFREEEKI